MAVSKFEELFPHVGHELECVSLNNDAQAGIECLDCNLLLIAFNKGTPEQPNGNGATAPPAGELHYRKTKSGKWAVFGAADAITVGATVTVTLKNGSTKTEEIEEVGHPFDVNGVPHVYGYPKKQDPPQGQPRQRKASQPKASGQVCSECQQRPGRFPRTDSSGIAGVVCTRCNRYGDQELSFA